MKNNSAHLLMLSSALLLSTQSSFAVQLPTNPNTSETPWEQPDNQPVKSIDGNLVAYRAHAVNPVTNQVNTQWDIFVRNLKTQQSIPISITPSGQLGNSSSAQPAISADGRFVVFNSDASDLVPNDANNARDIFIRDLKTNLTTLVSVNSQGTQGNDRSDHFSISDDGRFVAFNSSASNLIDGDINNNWDIFLRDLKSSTTIGISLDTFGITANKTSEQPFISGNGRLVAFASSASNLVLESTNDNTNIFVRDWTQGKTTRVSVNALGVSGNDESTQPLINYDGRFVVFTSLASNLVDNDNNNDADVFMRNLENHKTTFADAGALKALKQLAVY
jgi:uncharacterized membrane protein